MAGLKPEWVEDQSGKAAVPARTGGGLSRVDPWTHWYAQDLAMGEVLMGELGKFLCLDIVPASEHKNHDREQPRPGQRKIPTGIHLAYVGDRPI